MSEAIKSERVLPKSWQLKKLGEVVQIVYGKGLPVKDLKQSGFPVFGANGIIGFNDKYLYKEPMVLISCRGASSGKVNFSPEKCFITNNSLILDILDERNLDKKFLYYALTSCNKGKLVTGTAQPQVTINNAVELEISVPPLATQHRIVAKIEELFTELDKGVAHLKAAQQQLKTYRQSLLKAAFEGRLTNKNVKEGELPKGWRIGRVIDYAISIVPNRDKPKSFSGTIKWVTTPNLISNSIYLQYDNIELGLTHQEIQDCKAKIIPIGSVILTCVGTFGLASIVEEEIVINQQLHAFVPNNNLNPKYLAYQIVFNKSYFENVATSTTIQYVNKEKCNQMPLVICNISEQQKIVEILESKLSSCDKLEQTIKDNLAQTEQMKQSILKQAFEGRLVEN